MNTKAQGLSATAMPASTPVELNAAQLAQVVGGTKPVALGGKPVALDAKPVAL